MTNVLDLPRFFKRWRKKKFIRRNRDLTGIVTVPSKVFEVDDYVMKVTGDYHITGYVLVSFYTKWTRKQRYVVEHKAEGGGSFCHIYSAANLELIEKAKK